MIIFININEYYRQHAINAIWRALRAESAAQFMKFFTNLKPRSGQNRQTGTYSCSLQAMLNDCLITNENT
jgi:hypothetical protein